MGEPEAGEEEKRGLPKLPNADGQVADHPY